MGKENLLCDAAVYATVCCLSVCSSHTTPISVTFSIENVTPEDKKLVHLTCKMYSYYNLFFEKLKSYETAVTCTFVYVDVRKCIITCVNFFWGGGIH